MAKVKNNLHIELLGTAFSISADEEQEYLEKLLRSYEDKVVNTKKLGLEDPLKIAILTGFLLCDEIEKLSAANHAEAQEVERRTLRAIALLDEAIGDTGNVS